MKTCKGFKVWPQDHSLIVLAHAFFSDDPCSPWWCSLLFARVYRSHVALNEIVGQSGGFQFDLKVSVCVIETQRLSLLLTDNLAGRWSIAQSCCYFDFTVRKKSLRDVLQYYIFKIIHHYVNFSALFYIMKKKVISLRSVKQVKLMFFKYTVKVVAKTHCLINIQIFRNLCRIKVKISLLKNNNNCFKIIIWKKVSNGYPSAQY